MAKALHSLKELKGYATHCTYTVGTPGVIVRQAIFQSNGVALKPLTPNLNPA